MDGPLARVRLPGGTWRDGVRHTDVAVRSVSGADELFLQEQADSLCAAERVTALLARCTVGLGAERDPPETAARALTVGDREALLLHLRRLTFGDRMRCTLTCPRPGCGAALETELRVERLLVPPYPDAPQWHEIAVEDGDAASRVRFRLPTGADQEAVASLAGSNPTEAASQLLRRCLSGGFEGPIPPAVANRVADLLPELDPQAELSLDVTCGACGEPFSVLFDTADFFFAELGARKKALFNEVHTIALSYHWSEADILAMSSAKRWRYLDLIADTLHAARA